MADTTNTTGGIGKSIQQLFSPPVLAALRYLLTAISPLLAIVGVVALKPDQIEHIIAAAQQIGVIVGALAAFIGVLAPIGAGIYGTFKSTQPQQVKSVAVIAQDPTQAQSAPAQQALVQATAAIASNNILAKSDDAKQTLIAATIALPEVQTIVTDKATADASPSESVVAAESVTITPPTK